MSAQFIMLDDQTADVAAGAAKQGDGLTEYHYDRKERLLHLSGTFDGATVTLSISMTEGGTYVAPTELTFTEAAVKAVEIPGDCYVSASVASAGASTSVTMILTGR